MRKSKADPRILDHLEWLGFVKPVGLVVSAPALVRVGAILNRRDSDGQCALRELIEQRMLETKAAVEGVALDFESFAKEVLGWSFSPNGYAGTANNPVPEDLSISLTEGGETLCPDFAVRELDPKEGASTWQLLIQVLEPGTEFDKVTESKSHVELSPQGRMERLLRKSGVGAGLLFNGRALRLVSAPKGESSGWLDFSVADMASTAGRPICAAMRMLLSQERLLSLPRAKRLPALLEDSRKFQNEVSERLAEQVLEGLYEFLRGFQAAHDASKGQLLKEVLEGDPDVVYRALLTVILRMVFLLYAEERDMLPQDEIFLRNYSIAGLHERLREDAALNPDTMDQRFGAWAQLVVLFRMVYDGAEYPGGKLPKRHGDLFDPERFPFLEGRKERRTQGQRFEVPLVPDGTIYRVLEKLLVLDGERLSYRALDVEQIGSVYETMMGFRVDTATGKSIAIRAEKRHGAPTTINLEALLSESGAKREKWLQDKAGRKLSDAVKKGVKDATSLEGLHSALHKVVDQRATPDIVPPGSLILQPSEARRKSGSHYTPRSLTEPIVRTTLEPILARLASEAPLALRGERGGGEGSRTPTSEQILDLKVCDPAMGSGAFLVETCRQLAEALIESWQAHGGRPAIPVDEDEVIFARRMVAQRCLYGVDKNPMAVDLAKVSLWLATLAKGHAFTFLDHSLKCGDSLVGLTNKQILAMTWENQEENPLQPLLLDETLPDRIRQSAKVRSKIAEASGEEYDELVEELANASQYVNDLRLVGNAVIAAFFSAEKPKDRLKALAAVRDLAKALFLKASLSDEQHLRRRLHDWSLSLSTQHTELLPLHWELAFAEVFLEPSSGFNAIVGNPPFTPKNGIAEFGSTSYLHWLLLTPHSNGKSDVVAYFFRQSFALLRNAGSLGLVATKTISQGDTRSNGLTQICTRYGGYIYSAKRDFKWPGLAQVRISTVNISKGVKIPCVLDGRSVAQISSFLVESSQSLDPYGLQANEGRSFQGCNISGQGFLFADGSEGCSSLQAMNDVVVRNPKCADVIRSYFGGEDINTMPELNPYRFVIALGRRSIYDCSSDFPELVEILESLVKPDRESRPKNAQQAYLSDRWWQWHTDRPTMQRAIQHLDRFLVASQTTAHVSFRFADSQVVFSHAANIFALSASSSFACLQSSCHEVWAKMFGSSLGDTLRYTPTDCFETFPFPKNWESDPALDSVGQAYYEFRAALMIRNNEGLTKTYNRFHDPEETSPDIHRLRELHAEMDRAVLDAYGWTDVPTDCEFILDYDDDDEEEGGGKRMKKKPWRYRWPDEVRDEVLARLLELNKQRYEEEVRLGLHAKGSSKRTKQPKDSVGQASLLEDDLG